MRFSELALLATCHLFLCSTQTDKTFNCAKKFWPSLKAGSHFTVNDQCHFFQGYPRTIGATRVSVVYTKEWTGSADKAAPVLDEALTNSLKYYRTLASVPSAIVVILTAEVEDPYSLETWFPITKKPPCQVKAFQKWTDTISTNAAWAKQALAHELYHCVQQLKLGSGPSGEQPSSQWVMEGSANYLSNVVFPSANYKWPGAQPDRDYDPSLLIYAQVDQHVYGASLCFQSLENLEGPAELSKGVLATKEVDSGNAERHRLSTLLGFTDDFYTFAQQLSLQEIVDTSGVAIPGLPTVTPQKVSISGNAAVLKITPFTINVFQLSLPSGYSIKLSVPANAHQRVAYHM